MAVHRRQLPLAYQCEGFVPAPGSAGEGGFCERCQRQVHDVSGMREAELRRLLAAHAGGTVCLSYRTDAQGIVQLRPEPAPGRLQTLAVGALALLLAACAGHAGELEIPGATCRDADGYAVSCPEWSDPEMLSVPESEQLAARAVEEPSLRSIEPTSGDDAASEPGPEPPTVSLDPTSPPAAEPDGTAPGTTIDMETLRAIELEVHVTRGVMVVVTSVSYGPSEPREPYQWLEKGYVPTAELIEEARERRAERKVARQRWRVARRHTAASR